MDRLNHACLRKLTVNEQSVALHYFLGRLGVIASEADRHGYAPELDRAGGFVATLQELLEDASDYARSGRKH